MEENRILPQKILLEDYGGDYHRYIDAVYTIFKNDFIKHKTLWGTHKLNLKFNPIFQDRAYTFYHMTHEGEVEDERTPDLRRCECLPWAKPTLQNTQLWQLKFWRQERKNSKNRICIWLDNEDDIDYYVILEVRESYVLLWTAFVSEYSNSTKKKEKEYLNWARKDGNINHTPDSLIAEIQGEIAIKKQESP